ncbi:hypothetical protein [Ferruginibacter profundus]
MAYITFFDYVLLPIYLFFLYYIIKLKAIKYRDTDLHKYFITGFWIHMSGSFLYAMVIQYYYGYGDSFGFYQGAQVVRKMIAGEGNPITTFFLDPDGFSKIYKSSGDDSLYIQAGLSNSASLMVYKIATLFSYLSFNSYLIISLFFGLISFAGVWRLFCTFRELLQKQFEKKLAYAVLFLPSVCFWGSGLMKDSLCLGMVGFIFSAGYSLFAKKKYSLGNILVLVACLYILFVIKSYIASALLLAAALTYMIGIILKSRGNIIKLAFVLFILAVSVVFLSFSVSSSIESVIEESKSQIETFKTSYENYSDDEGTAGFKDADFDFTIGGIILRTPVKVTSTLFRPFVWETRKPIVLLSALESLLMLVALLYVLIKTKFFRFFYYVAINPEIFFSFVFVMLLAAIVGFTTFNFGTLVRYRLPIMPFYFFMLLAVYRKHQQRNAETTTAVIIEKT